MVLGLGKPQRTQHLRTGDKAGREKCRCDDVASPGKASVWVASRVPLVVRHEHRGHCSVLGWHLAQSHQCPACGLSPLPRAVTLLWWQDNGYNLPQVQRGWGGWARLNFIISREFHRGLASNLVALHDHVLLKPSVTHDDRKFPLKWRNYPEQRKGLWLLTTKNTEAPGGKMPLGQMPGGYKQSPAGGDTRASVQTHWAFRAVTWTSAPPCAQKGEPRMEGCPPPSA